MTIIVEVSKTGEISVYCDTPAEVEVINWSDIGEQIERCPSLYANLSEQTERRLSRLTTGMLCLHKD